MIDDSSRTVFYSIGSVILEAEDYLPPSYDSFLVRRDHQRVSDLFIVHTDKLHPVSKFHKRAQPADLNVWEADSPEDNYRWIFEKRDGSCTIAVDADYKRAEYAVLEELSCFPDSEVKNIISPLFQVLTECKLLQKGYAALHAATVELNGIAYAFTGPSGIGKSSRAERWCELLSAEWISGDRIAIDPYKQLACGVPWDGKEQIYRNVNCPIGAILSVKRSGKTQLIEMTMPEKIKLLCEQCFLPMWDTELLSTALQSIKCLAERVPIYELACDITDESTYKSYEAIARQTAGSMER